MTNSLAIAPQRQRRDFFKKPQKGPTLAATAAPAREPVQVGDQLLDMRRYEPGNQAQAIQAIENFVGNQGGLSKLSQWAMEAHVKKAEKDAQALREQRAVMDQIQRRIISNNYDTQENINLTNEISRLYREQSAALTDFNSKLDIIIIIKYDL